MLRWWGDRRTTNTVSRFFFGLVGRTTLAVPSSPCVGSPTDRSRADDDTAFGVGRKRRQTARRREGLGLPVIDHRGLPAHKIERLWTFKLFKVEAWVRDGGADMPEADTGAVP